MTSLPSYSWTPFRAESTCHRETGQAQVTHSFMAASEFHLFSSHKEPSVLGHSLGSTRHIGKEWIRQRAKLQEGSTHSADINLTGGIDDMSWFADPNHTSDPRELQEAHLEILRRATAPTRSFLCVHPTSELRGCLLRHSVERCKYRCSFHPCRLY